MSEARRLILSFTFVGGILVASLSPSARGDAVPVKGRPKTNSGLVTLQGTMPLKQALAQLAEQTGVAVSDRRAESGRQPAVKLNLRDASFWLALDAIAQQSGARVSLYEQDRRIALRDGSVPRVPVSYSGRFRIVLKKIEVATDFETATHLGSARLELAWLPTFEPLFLESRPGDVSISEPRDTPLRVASTSGRDPVSGRNGVEIPIGFEAPPRSVHSLARLQGTLRLVGPDEMLSFTFDRLDAGAAAPEQSRAGVSVRLQEFKAGDERWKISLLLSHPSGEPDFESFESWLATTQVELQKRVGKERLAPAGYEMTEQPGHRVRLTYYFSGQNGPPPGHPDDWKLFCRTPGPIGTVAIPFEFKDVPLP